MYLLQAILLILKLTPDRLFYWGDILVPNGCAGFYSDFTRVSWWIILIPSYFILGKVLITTAIERDSSAHANK